MTTAHFIRKNGAHTVSVTGHANHSHPDIVCAAASMLSCTLIHGLEKCGGLMKDVRPGKVFIKTRSNAKTDAVTDTVRGGFYLLSRKYPENVVLREEGYEEDN